MIEAREGKAIAKGAPPTERTTVSFDAGITLRHSAGRTSVASSSREQPPVIRRIGGNVDTRDIECAAEAGCQWVTRCRSLGHRARSSPSQMGIRRYGLQLLALSH